MTAFAIEFPAYGQVRASNELRKKGIFVASPSGVRSIWLRHGLESMNLRLTALEKKSAVEERPCRPSLMAKKIWEEKVGQLN